MPADVLTKDDLGKSNGALEEILRTSRFGLWSEEEELKQRKLDAAAKNKSSSFLETAKQIRSVKSFRKPPTSQQKSGVHAVQCYHLCLIN